MPDAFNESQKNKPRKGLKMFSKENLKKYGIMLGVALLAMWAANNVPFVQRIVSKKA